MSREQRLLLLLGIYWGEGNKRELNLINSDPALIKTFLSCLYDMGMKKEELRITLRLYDGIDKEKSRRFWAKLLSIRIKDIRNINTIQGNKIGKLKYGMCRVRVAKSAPYFKLIMSLLSEIKERFNAAVVQRIEQGTPKP